MFDVDGWRKRSLANHFHRSIVSLGFLFAAFPLKPLSLLGCRTSGRNFYGCFMENPFVIAPQIISSIAMAVARVSAADKQAQEFHIKRHNYPSRLFRNLCIFYEERHYFRVSGCEGGYGNLKGAKISSLPFA